MTNRIPWFAVGLIVVGTAMILDRFDVISLAWPTVLWGLVAVFGAERMITGFSTRRRGRVFWGSFLFLFGVYRVLYRLDLVEVDHHLWFPTLMLILGLSFLAMYLAAPKEWPLLVPALIFVGFGGTLLLAEYGYFNRWEVMWAIKRYWPLALILFGFSLLVKRRLPGT
jgi:hypothetical protein